jgi:hypothetical protein
MNHIAENLRKSPVVVVGDRFAGESARCDRPFNPTCAPTALYGVGLPCDGHAIVALGRGHVFGQPIYSINPSVGRVLT